MVSPPDLSPREEVYMSLPFKKIVLHCKAGALLVPTSFYGKLALFIRAAIREEVLANLKEALVSYVTTSLDNNMEIPEPLKIDDFKGSITYRTSRERHYSLAKQAKLYGKSINAFIDEAISEKLKQTAL